MYKALISAEAVSTTQTRCLFRSCLTGDIHERTFDVPLEMVMQWVNGHVLIQTLPLTPDERELFLSGMTPAEWARCFSEDDVSATIDCAEDYTKAHNKQEAQ